MHRRCGALLIKMMIRLFALSFLIISNVELLGQGGVNVRYVPMDSVGASIERQEVKIDFKGKNVKNNLTQKARIPDTVRIILGDKPIDLIEVKGTGVDYWYFDKEYLESNNYRSGQVLRIYKIELQKIVGDSILVRMTLQLYEKGKRKSLKQLGSETKDLWILKRMLDGVMIKV